MQCVIWTNPGDCLCGMNPMYRWPYLYKVLVKCFKGYQFFFQTLNKQGNYKTDFADVSAPFGQSEFVQILTTIFCLSMMMFSVDSPGITTAGKVCNMHVNVYYRNVENFDVSFRICSRLFVIITMTSLGYRKRAFRHRARCEREVAYVKSNSIWQQRKSYKSKTSWEES